MAVGLFVDGLGPWILGGVALVGVAALLTMKRSSLRPAILRLLDLFPLTGVYLLKNAVL